MRPSPTRGSRRVRRYKQKQEAVMRLIALGTASVITTILSFSVEAADLFYPPSDVGSPQYGTAPPTAVAPPQVLVVPGAPVAVPHFDGAPAPPAAVGPSPYTEGPRVAVPGAAPGPPPPRAACDPVWRCGNAGCGWEPNCRPPAEHYAGPYRAAGAPALLGAPPPPGALPRPDRGAGAAGLPPPRGPAGSGALLGPVRATNVGSLRTTSLLQSDEPYALDDRPATLRHVVGPGGSSDVPNRGSAM